MTQFTITGDDTLTLNGRVLNNLADGDVSTITFPNNIVEMKTGKNQNTIFSKNETGNNASLILRVLRGSSDDRFLQSLYNNMVANFTDFILLNGQFVKQIGDGQGNRALDTYTVNGGVFVKNIEASTNVQGTTDQGVSIYNITFATSKRTQQ